MAQINQNRYETLAARTLGVKGPGVFGHAEDMIFAGLALDTNSPIELWYPQRIYRYAVGVQVGGVVGAGGGIELRNTSIDQLWIVDSVQCSSTTATVDYALWVGEDTTADFYANALLASNVDTRIAGASARDWGSSGTGLVTIPGFGKICHTTCAGNAVCNYDPGVILGPGGSFIANNLATNSTTRFCLSFHTRQAMPGEL